MNNLIAFTTFGFITLVALFCILAVFKMKYESAARLARQRGDADTSYRDLAAQAVKSQEANAALLADIAGRLASVEKLLKEVG